MELTVRTARYLDADVQELMELLQQEFVVRFGGRDETPVEPQMFDPPHGLFAVGYEDGLAVASGAWRMRSDPGLPAPTCAEIKRMYVRPEVRGKGHGRAVLTHLEATAQQAGAHWMILETGTALPEAMGLYTSAGYDRIPEFGHYRCAPGSRCFGRPLRGS